VSRRQLFEQPHRRLGRLSRLGRTSKVQQDEGARAEAIAFLSRDAVAQELASGVLAIIPFASAYKSLWLGLGALSLDLLLAVIVTSLLRHRLSPRLWRNVHWFAYAAWPFALLHGIGMGSDRARPWFLGINIACVAVVAAASIWRLLAVPADPKHLGSRLPEVSR